MRTIEEELLDAMEKLDEDSLLLHTKQLLESGMNYHDIEMLLQQGMRRVGKLFEQGEYFIADLIVSGMLFKMAMELFQVGSYMQHSQSSAGKVLIGVVAGDIHDIGKDIVIQVLRTENFEVIDLGIDVSAETFLKAACDHKPDIIALSGVMGSSAKEMKHVIEQLNAEGIHKFTPIIVGGSCINKKASQQIGADNYAEGPVDTMLLCKIIMENKIEL